LHLPSLLAPEPLRVTAPERVVTRRRSRFSTPSYGVVKTGAQEPRPEAPNSWTRPTPLIIQNRAKAVERALVAEGVTRVGVLLSTDLLVMLLAHAAVDWARHSERFSPVMASFVAALVPRGTFPRVEVITAVLIGLAIFGNYRGGGRWRNLGTLLAGSSLGLSLVFWSALWGGATVEAGFGFIMMLAALGLTLASGRQLLYAVQQWVHPTPLKVCRALILGSRGRAEHLQSSDAIRLNGGLTVVGHVNVDRTIDEDSLGALSDLVWIIERHNIDTIIIADTLEDDALVDVLEVAERTGCTAMAGSPIFPLGGFVPRVIMRSHIPYVSITRPSLRLQQLLSKRVFDVLAAATLLILLAPLFAAVALLVRLTSPGGIFFRQLRVGYGGKHFHMYKFRSMVRNAEELRQGLEALSVYPDSRLFKISNDPRITPIGRFLRRSSLDELPQLWNVLRNDMSLVGPRPPLATEVEKYEEYNYTRFDMKPGITGPWQVSGRNRITSFDEVITLETDYLSDWSLLKDFAILMKTVPAVLSMEGAV
jgi:exopolysaccharide biosynthesis polyprenyl glycosylphosphotransferase